MIKDFVRKSDSREKELSRILKVNCSRQKWDTARRKDPTQGKREDDQELTSVMRLWPRNIFPNQRLASAKCDPPEYSTDVRLSQSSK